MTQTATTTPTRWISRRAGCRQLDCSVAAFNTLVQNGLISIRLLPGARNLRYSASDVGEVAAASTLRRSPV